MTDFQDVRDADGKLLFRFDKERSLIEIQHRGRKQLVDLLGIDNKQPLDKPCPDNVD